MALQYGTTLRTNQVAAIQTTVGSSSATLVIYSGTVPASCGTALTTQTPLVTISLPSTFLTSSGGIASLSGTWSAIATASGTASFFRILDGSGICHVQGNTTGDLTLTSTSIVSGGAVSVTAFSVTAGNS